MLFTYERMNTGNWQPVVFHEPPSKSVNGKDPERKAFVEVPQDCVGSDGTPNFGKLRQRFPLERN